MYNNLRKSIYIVILINAISAQILPGDLFAQVHPSDDTWVESSQVRGAQGYDFTDYLPIKDMSYSYAGKVFSVDKPAIGKDGDIWIPIGPVLTKMETLFMKIDDSRFGIIRSDGMPLEFKIGDTNVTFNKAPFITMERPPALYEGTFMVSIKSFAKILDLDCNYNSAINTIELGKGKVEELETFTLPNPKPVEKKELTAPVPLPAARAPTDIRDEILPDKYKRDLDLHLDFNMSYLESKVIHDRTRQAEWYLYGRALDYTIDGHYRMKDFRTSPEKERFKSDAQFISIYGKGVQYKFLDNFVTIPTLRSQSQQFWGVEGTSYNDPFRTTVLFGKTDDTAAGTAAIGSVRYYGDLTVIRTGYTMPSGTLKTTETLIIWENSAANAGQVATTTFPRRNLAFITENTVAPLHDKSLKFNYSLGVSNYQPDNYVNTSFLDNDWKIGAELGQPLFGFLMSYEHVGANFVSFGLPSTYQDYEGLDFSTNFRFSKNWTVSVGGLVSKNNVQQDPLRPTTYSKNLTISNGLTLPWEQSVYFTYSVNESYNRGGNVDENGTRYQDYRVDYSKTWGNLTAQLSYDHYWLDMFKAATGGSVTDSASGSLFNYYPSLNNSYIRFYQDYRKVKNIQDLSYTTEYGDTAITGRLNVTSYLSGTVDWKVAYTLKEAFADTAVMTLDVGTEYKPFPAATFNFDFTLNNYDLYNQKTWIPKDYTLLFRGRYIFDIYTPDKWGKVRVFVYKDLNSNAKWDPGEPGIKNVRVYIGNGRAKFTNENGVAIIDKVGPGNRQVKVDLSTIPLEYVTRVPSIIPITIKPMQQINIEFPIVKTGNVTGRVYIDKNNNGKYDKFVDEPLPNIRVYLSPGDKDTLTLSDGSYYFDFAYPGTYELCVDAPTLPPGVRPKGNGKMPLVVKEGDRIKGADFPIAPQKVDIQLVEE